MKKTWNHDNTIALLLAAGVFIVYLRTMSSHVGTEDPGELAAAMHTLGIVHPTGYPLFTMLGWGFSHLPLGDTVIWRLNLFGAVLTSVATFLFFRVFLQILSSRIAAAAATLTFAFSAVYWSEAVTVEVYALHLVFLPLVTGLFLKALAATQSASSSTAVSAALRGKHPEKPWTIFAFVLGLSFTNHMMTVLLAPAFLYLYFAAHGFGRAGWIRILRMAPPFLLALSLYLYLPLRALQDPVMNWGDPSTPGAFWRHITAAQYGQQMFSSWEIAMRKLAQFTVDLPRDFGYAPLLLAALGLWSLRRAEHRRLLVFTVLIFVTGLFYAINYSFDDPNFHLNPHFMVALWAGFGTRALLVKAGGASIARTAVRVRTSRLAVAAVGAVALCPLAFNYTTLDKSRDSLVEDYARNVLNSMDSGAVFFSNEYERLGSPAFYLQQVEGFRGDVAVLDIILLGNPWFFPHLEARHPWLIEKSREAVDAYRTELHRFTFGPADTVAYNMRLRALFRSLIEESRAAGRPVYFSSGINAAEAPGYGLVPSGMVFRLEPESGGSDGSDSTPYIAPRDFIYAPLPPLRVNKLSEKIRIEYAEGYANQGAHLLGHGDTAGAADRFRKALAVYPDFPEVLGLFNSITVR